MSKSGFFRCFSAFDRGKFAKLLVLALIALWLGFAAFLPTVDAHAELVRTTPAAGDRIDAGPASVELLFNERLDTGGLRLDVLDEKSRPVTNAVPERFDQGKGIRLILLKLGEGHYTVSYSVISADGHPVSGAFVFTVGNPAPLPDAGQLDPHAQVGHDRGSSAATDRQFLIYLTRIAYYAGLLVTAGLAFWSLHRNASPLVRQLRDQALAFSGKFTLLSTLAYVAISLLDLSQDEPVSEWLRILSETTIGRLYAGELLLALAAPLLVGLGVTGRVFWAVVFLLIEAWSGHSAAFTHKTYTITLDFVHLSAASLWTGGLVLLFLLWLKERPEAGRFALLFSKWALYAFLVLWVTGILSMVAFLPSLIYLTFMPWGTWLIVKMGVSLLVAVTALLIRRRLRRGDLPQGALLKADLGLMSAIVFIVGVFTYLSPLHPNQALHFHEMGTDMHATLRITPNAPGDNAFTLKVWLPLKDGAPKQVKLRLLPIGRSGVGSIDVPLQIYNDKEIDDFPEFGKFTYQAQGPFLPFAGQWTAQIRVTDSTGKEMTRETTFRIY